MQATRIPFDFVRLQDAILEEETITRSHNDDELPYTLWQQYLCVLDTCGWSRIDFENELIKLIDKDWVLLHRRLHG
jgi:hypothetical protein